ncbi:MAG TPA: histidine triad nucleotide-binding protein, partial [Cellvibrionales bacterium]|nr:histidine triad nucleotide-binding protein [Cellvibrionales bacterium]
MTDTVFAKIIAGEIPSEKLYEDEHCIVIPD